MSELSTNLKYVSSTREIFQKNRTSKAMVLSIIVDLGECPPSDKSVVECEHGTHVALIRYLRLLAK